MSDARLVVAESMVARIVSYEQSSPAAELTLVADANDGYEFEAATAQLRALVPGDIRVVEIDRDGLLRV